jgi:hypothetical protein
MAKQLNILYPVAAALFADRNDVIDGPSIRDVGRAPVAEATLNRLKSGSPAHGFTPWVAD